MESSHRTYHRSKTMITYFQNQRLQFLSLKNSVDFRIRNLLRWSPPVRETDPQIKRDQLIQSELTEFFKLFPWENLSREISKTPAVIDIGARNFVSGPAIENVLHSHGFDPTIEGIEIDGHRRLINLRTRKSYGDFYAKQLTRAKYHVMDILNWTRKVDIAFLLNPFITESSITAWGLPVAHLKPRELFCHVRSLLKPNGVVVLSNPHEFEQKISLEIALQAGFQVRWTATWSPTSDQIQQDPRLGALLSLPQNR